MGEWRLDQRAHKPFDIETADWHATLSRSNGKGNRGDCIMLQFSSNAEIKTQDAADELVSNIQRGLNEKVK